MALDMVRVSFTTPQERDIGTVDGKMINNMVFTPGSRTALLLLRKRTRREEKQDKEDRKYICQMMFNREATDQDFEDPSLGIDAMSTSGE